MKCSHCPRFIVSLPTVSCTLVYIVSMMFASECQVSMSCLLYQQLKVRDERLGEASDLQKFLQNLDHFQQWLTRTQTTIASEDIPSDLAEAERMLNQHEQIKSEIDGYADEYASMKNYGEQVVEGQDDVQYMFLREVSVELLLGNVGMFSHNYI